MKERFGIVNNSRGVTVMELLLVLVLIVILTMMFVPGYVSDVILKEKVAGVAHDIAGDLRLARRMAINGGPEGDCRENYWFRLFATGSIVFKNSNPASAVHSTEIVGNDVRFFNPGIAFNNPTPAAIARPSIAYIFSATGSVITPATGGVIVVSDTDNKFQWNVSVVRTTGRIILTRIK